MRLSSCLMADTPFTLAKKAKMTKEKVENS